MRRVQLADLPWEEVHSPARKFHSFFRNVSVGLGGIRNVGPWGGGHPFDLQVRRVPSGAAVCPYHVHLAQWELFVVLNGRGTVRTPDGSFPVRVGSVFVHPAGAAHQLSNEGSQDLEVLILADNPPLDACYYPDSNKWGLRPPGKFFRMEEAGYFDGEEPPVAGAPPYQPTPAPPLPPVAPFAQRCVHLDEVPWENFASPRQKFRSQDRELSLALGAKRNTPVGLGGHPFDIELAKLPPGAAPCPFHSHAAQWELYFILGGKALVRANDETATLGPGDIVLHPPGEAHQIRNASQTDDLLFYLVADNPPVDYWHYPDSQKWGVRSPRMFFRPTPADYWDGEE